MSEGNNQRPSRAHPTRGLWWAMGLLGGVILLSPRPAASEGLVVSGLSGQLLWKSRSTENPLLRGSAKLSGNYELDLRRLTSDPRPSATRRLVQLSTQQAVLNEPTRRLALVRALAVHEDRLGPNNSARVDVVRSLIRLFAAEDEIEQSGADLENESGALRHLARGSAGMALARSGHPLALKKLLALALHGEQLDPVGAGLALTALRSLDERSLDEHALDADDLVRLFSKEAIARITAPEETGVELAAKNLTPKSLVKRAKQAGNSWGKSQQEDIPLDGEVSFEELLRHLLQRDALPRSFADVREWEAAFEKDRIWTLRTIALLSPRLEARVIDLGQRMARTAAQSASKLEQSAGAWCIAIIMPSSVPELLEKKDDVMTRAILRQASEGEVARTFADFIQKKKLSQEHERLALRMVLQDPALWSTFSTASLHQHETEHGPIALSALTSRLRTSAPGLGPDLSAVRGFLQSPSTEVRAATAFGLSHSSKGSARGILLWAYRKESSPLVRRAIVAAIKKTELAESPEFLQLLAIDPDQKCREVISDRKNLESTRPHLSWTKRRTVTVADREGRILEVSPAPDGFVGIVRSSF